MVYLVLDVLLSFYLVLTVWGVWYCGVVYYLVGCTINSVG